MTSDGTASGQPPDQQLGDNAVNARLKQVEHVLEKGRKAWYLTPSNVISVGALLATVGIFSITMVLATRDEQVRKQEQVGQLIEQISKLAGEEAGLYAVSMPPSARASAFMAIGNRRNVLLRQAESLLEDVEQQMTKLELALLATTYMSAGLLDKAEPHLKNLANAEGERTNSRVMAWRSLALLYAQLGPEYLEKAKNAATQGLKLINSSEPNVVLQTGELFLIPFSLASGLAITGQYEAAFDYFITAEQTLRKMPCTSHRLEFQAVLRFEMEKFLALYPEGHDVLSKVRKEYRPVQPCPRGPTPAVASMTQSHSNDRAPRPSTSDLTGTYEMGSVSVIIDADTNGNLSAKDLRLARYPIPLVPLGRDVFVLQSTPLYYLYFLRGNTGHVTELRLLQPNGPYFFRRKLR